MMVDNPDGSDGTGGDEKIELTKAEFNKLVEGKAQEAQANASLTTELTELRKKNRELSGQNPVQAEDVTKAVQEALKERDTESAKANQDNALALFLDSHSEFSQVEDTDGSKFAAFKAALSRLSTNSCKTVADFTAVLEDALRLMERRAESNQGVISSTVPVTVTVQGQKTSVRLTDKEARLVQRSFDGDALAYLKIKEKRPAYVEELLQWVK